MNALHYFPFLFGILYLPPAIPLHLFYSTLLYPTVIWSRCMSSCTVAASVAVTEQPELPLKCNISAAVSIPIQITLR